MSTSLRRGDLLPRMRVAPPGPRSRALSRDLAKYEAPAVNTLVGGTASVVWEAATGVNVLDVDGNRYLDLSAGFGVAAVGHRHPDIVAAVRHQASRLVHAMADVAAHPPRIELARRLASLVPVPDAAVYFAISGSDAVEIALETAALASGRPAFLAFDPAYHGTTLGALAATSRPRFREPFRRYLHGEVVRLPFAAPVASIEALLDARPDVGAVLVEPICGREGILVPPRGWLDAMAGACRRRGVLLVADEIFTGLGRTGSWFRVEAEGVAPDLLCCGKALGGGLPIAAVVGRRPLLDAWDSHGEALHTATFLGHPLASAAALAVLDVLDRQGLPERAAGLGELVAERLERGVGRHPQVTATRGTGLLWGIELTTSAAAAAWVARLRAEGILALAGGPDGRVLQLSPPLVITERQLEHALATLETTLSAIG